MRVAAEITAETLAPLTQDEQRTVQGAQEAGSRTDRMEGSCVFDALIPEIGALLAAR